MHDVMIHPATYEDCRKAVDRAFELFPVDMKNKKIVIKPNVLRPVQHAANVSVTALQKP